MKNEKLRLAILVLVLLTIEIVITLMWYDWKLFVIIFIAQFSNNISRMLGRLNLKK